MRSVAESHARWKATFESFTHINDLRSAVELRTEGNPCEAGLRSICWKAFLLFQNLDTQTWKKTLSDSREAYTSLKQHFLKNIENSDDISADDLSGDTESSPWIILRNDEDLRAEIWQDVERCMPENSYFREPVTQSMLLEILFIYCKLNRDISYRQGMHEVLAPVLWVVSCDAIDPSSARNDDSGLADIENACLKHDYIEHDAFSLFSNIMQTVRTFYELSSSSEQPGFSLANNTPIVQRSKRIHQHFLQLTDPELAEHLTAIEILPQIFLIRWIRLLFGREFPFEDVLSLWDSLFAEDPELELIDLISVSMLLRIRWQLLEADYTAALTLLLRYPVPTAPHKAVTFVSDALYLRENLNLDGGDHIISKYSSRAPETTVTRKLPKKVKRARTAEQDAAHKAAEAAQAAKIVSPDRRREQRGIDEIIQETAKGLYVQGEKWGVTKALRGAVQGIQSGQVTPRKILHRSRQSIDSFKSGELQPPNELLKRIEMLEQRNKSLAGLLEEALDDLSKKEVALQRADVSAEEGDLSLAIAKIQFAKVHLENPSMPLPTTDESCKQEDTKGGTTMPQAPRDRGDSRSPRPNPPANFDGALEKRSTLQNDPILLPSPMTATSSSTLAPSTPPMKAQNPGKVLDEKSLSLEQTRPTLAQSPYSWMLGEGRSRSDFVATSPTAPSATSIGRSHPASLFQEGKNRAERKHAKVTRTSGKSLSQREVFEGADVFLTEPGEHG